ncbi:unnamed protein product [Amoebophrya sp. A120]|nr:unnamed protein product [Amoebophrya sp. A120]|eukprot:GSA120T00011304001.1
MAGLAVGLANAYALNDAQKKLQEAKAEIEKLGGLLELAERNGATQAQTITSLENRIGQLEALAERLIETTKQNTEEIRSVKKAVKGLKGRIANLETTQNTANQARRRFQMGGGTEEWKETFKPRARDHLIAVFGINFSKMKISAEIEQINSKPSLERIAKEVSVGRNFQMNKNTKCAEIRQYIRYAIGFQGLDN